MIAIIMNVRIKPGKVEQFVALVEQLRRDVLANEPDTLCFEVLHDLDDPLLFTFTEIFTSEAARERHAEAPYHKAMSEAGWACVDGNSELQTCRYCRKTRSICVIGSLKNRVALVTGCTGGIGSQIAVSLAEAGAYVIGADLPADGGTDKAWQAYHQLDVTDEANWQSVIASIEEAQGRLDILVHVAGIVVVEKLEATSLADWRKQMAGNVDGPLLGTKAAVDLMRRSGADTEHGASIVNISSVAGLIGSPLHTGYCASKGALRLFTKACAMEFSALGYKIRVNSIHPSGVNTGMVEHILQRFVDNGFAASIEEARAGLAPAHPIGRMADPIDIAKAVRFLAGDESGYMHGAELVVDGGYTAQ